jgi:AraC-like DNA-binding protein
MDALSELLRVIRLSGTAFIDADLYAPWAVETPPPSAIAARLAPGAGRIIPYHLVTEGACHVRLKAHAPVELSAGQVIMFPHGDVHVLASMPGLTPLQITTDAVVRLTRPDSIARVRYGGNGARTRLICGFFACDEVLSEQLVARLPRLMHCKIGADSGATLLSRSVQTSRAAAQLGLGAVLGKLSELLFVDAIRAYVASMSQHEGWLTGLRDRYVSRGLALIYGRPGDHWTVESLARTVGVSKTALADHFVRCTGMAPMQYLSQWRLRVAADGLRHTDRAIKRIAEAAGFGSTAAFSRAFRREFGVSPDRWRRDQRIAARPGPQGR